jgi:hypothetical protein
MTVRQGSLTKAPLRSRNSPTTLIPVIGQKYDLVPRVTNIIRATFDVKGGTLASPEGSELPLQLVSRQGEDIVLRQIFPARFSPIALYQAALTLTVVRHGRA